MALVNLPLPRRGKAHQVIILLSKLLLALGRVLTVVWSWRLGSAWISELDPQALFCKILPLLCGFSCCFSGLWTWVLMHELNLQSVLALICLVQTQLTVMGKHRSIEVERLKWSMDYRLCDFKEFLLLKDSIDFERFKILMHSVTIIVCHHSELLKMGVTLHYESSVSLLPLCISVIRSESLTCH
jgi:hypothetical protein